MTDVLAVAMVGAIPGTLALILNFINNITVQRTERHTLATKATMEHLEKNTNSKIDLLLKTQGEAEFAKGVKQEEDKVRGRGRKAGPLLK